VNLEKVSAATIKAWWFDPRSGQATPIGEFPGSGRREFTSPNPGEDIDWVLVLDDASKGYPPPGSATGKSAENWPGFRGPGGQGHSSEVELPLEWNEKKNVAWVAAIPGEGWSSPIVWNDRVFVTTAADGGKSCRVLALDRRKGGILWDKEVFQQKPGHKQDKNSHATPTPVTDGRLVYTLFGDGSFASLSFDGAVVWTHREVEFYGEHGLGASPLLHGDLLIMPFDGSSSGPDPKVGWQTPWDQSFILALDKRTGKERWRGKRGLSRIAHVSPVIIRAGGRDEILSCAGDAIQGFDPATGERLWNIFSEGEGVVPTPAFGGGLIFTASGFGSPAIRAVRPGGRGDITGTHIAWEQRRGVPKMSSLLHVEPHLYSVGDNGVVFCYREDDGKVVWQERVGGAFSASPVFAAGRIYLLDEEGKTTVLAPGPRFEVLARNTLEGRCQASMAVSGGGSSSGRTGSCGVSAVRARHPRDEVERRLRAAPSRTSRASRNRARTCTPSRPSGCLRRPRPRACGFLPPGPSDRS
jgi:outer membrane protein assembly factor BamB